MTNFVKITDKYQKLRAEREVFAQQFLSGETTQMIEEVKKTFSS